ncbi:hypothetical protein N7474_000597 [Penicillium riverlandense]|uniref:uncharacterized protein n=1 Tax=Penicillium riverlandense TaxID=1903569 RepID=UPI0025488CDC|nr:uncharacterized protein N7474_000597 [Penicillium riverlandense]KAJ5832286.1 hypothetical protein N7474_000597 [Penicillium riverlandense]
MSIKTNSRLPVGNKDFTNATVVIIGAGISGMCMAIDLIKHNKCRNFIILEKSSSVGGTWSDNKYPGCCCDVWSSLYSYSFEQNPNWSREYPGQEEIHAYLVRVAEKYGLFKHIRFNSTVKSARWNEDESKWEVSVKVDGQKDSEFASSYVLNTEFLVSAVGQLNSPHEPNIPGLKKFQGKMMHSARWDWSYDFSHKRVAIIGNGATAAQILPEVAQVASHVTVYQRTPNWVTPRLDAPVSAFQQALLTYLPPIRWRKRALQMDFRELFYSAVTNNDSDFAKMIRDGCTNMMKTHLPDQPELWEKLTPNYAPGCKRVIISDDYYPALARDNVDLETRPITQITQKGIEVGAEDSQQYDLIVLATGFRTVEFMYPIEVYGKNGRPLGDIWKNGAMAYKGITVEDLPNFGMFYGPNTNLGHNSIILMIEAQSRYLNAIVAEVIRARQQGKTLTFTPKLEAMKEFNDKIQAVLSKTSFADPNCNSWYKRDDGIITNNWSGTVLNYQRELSELHWQDYSVEGTGKDAILAKKDAKLGRVREETIFSDSALLLGSLGIVAAGGSYFLAPRWRRTR